MPRASGRMAIIMRGCTWKIMSIGFSNPSSDFCMTFWDRVQRNPHIRDAVRHMTNPNPEKLVDLWVNRPIPRLMQSTITT